MPIDLGLEADALKLLPFTGSTSNPQLVKVPVTSTLSFGFEFGVFTGGQDLERDQRRRLLRAQGRSAARQRDFDAATISAST